MDGIPTRSVNIMNGNDDDHLTDEDRRILAEMKRKMRENPPKPIYMRDPSKFGDGRLVPADQVKDWHKVIEEGERRPPKQRRRKRPPAK